MNLTLTNSARHVPWTEMFGHASCAPGCGVLFLPADDTWHGFARRPITGVRRSLIVNYVTPEWRARDELAFPDLPVG